MQRFGQAALLAVCALLASAASAHDFFLLPDAFTTNAAGPVTIQATVGSSFPTPEIRVPADRTEQLSAFGPGSPRVRIIGAGDKALNVALTGAGAGLVAVGVASRPRDVDYGEDRIPLILEEYRVSPSAAAAVEALPRPRTWQVSSRRFAKTFLCVRSCGDRAAAARPFGAHLEFVGVGRADHHFRLLGRDAGHHDAVCGKARTTGGAGALHARFDLPDAQPDLIGAGMGRIERRQRGTASLGPASRSPRCRGPSHWRCGS